jgi:hypothetical protein
VTHPDTLNRLAELVRSRAASGTREALEIKDALRGAAETIEAQECGA